MICKYMYIAPMQELIWLGTSLKDLRGFPDEAKREAGTDLRLVQQGVDPRDWKPMPDVGKGVREIRNRTRDGAYRVFYVVEDAKTVYVLHAFQKTAQRTPKADMDMGRERYRQIP